MGSIGIDDVLQRIAISAAAAIGSIEQVTRLSVLNTSAGSLGINISGISKAGAMYQQRPCRLLSGGHLPEMLRLSWLLGGCQRSSQTPRKDHACPDTVLAWPGGGDGLSTSLR